LQSALGGAALGGDAAAQRLRRLRRLCGEFDGAGEGFERERVRGVSTEAQFAGGTFQRLDEVEDVGGAAAGNGGDGIEVVLALEPERRAHGTEDSFRGRAFGSSHRSRCEES